MENKKNLAIKNCPNKECCLDNLTEKLHEGEKGISQAYFENADHYHFSDGSIKKLPKDFDPFDLKIFNP